ncbi:arylalkylamine N-acetyltransferase-like 2 [Calliphora vicina]|uniref:arylalkylamine N-acetyltransferase-like 2 n=1 Tax=Calliphora vicina TaxID=7373 RepID=UPI00325AA9E1
MCRLNSPQCWRRSVHTSHAPLQHSDGRQQRETYWRYKQKPQEKQRSHHFVIAKQLIPVNSMSSSTCNSLSTNQLQIRVIKPQERQQVLDFLRVHYYLEEPLTVGSEPKQQDKEDEDFNMSNIEHDTCIMAVQKDDTNSQETIVGALMAGPKGPDEADHLFEEAANLGPTKWGHILQFLACVERDANICGRFKVQKVLHVHVMGVNREMHGQNIGRRLVEQVLNVAKRLNFKMVAADCTSYYSARLFERMGFECINIKYYKDYVDETGKQVFKPDAPHECVKTFALKL